MSLWGTRRVGAVAVAVACVLGTLGLAAPADSAVRLARNDTYLGAEDTVLRVKAAGGLLANDPVRRHTRRLSVVERPAHGRVVVTLRGGFRYRPAANWSGRDAFRYRVVDRRGRSSVAVARIDVRPVDDPTAVRDDATTGTEDTVVTGNVLANDVDIDGAPRVLQHNDARAPGSFSMRPGGDWTYTPAVDWSGVARVGYATTTGGLGTLTITVRPVDDPTTVVDDVATVMLGDTASGNVLDNDTDVDSVLTVIDAVIGDPNLRIEPDGSWTYNAVSAAGASAAYTTNTGAIGHLTITISIQ
ncbi:MULTISPECIES: Ig-like domain-containing protein [unclassified Nocardioides]|uniref:Ig-like domain-containing protein n=1 Tax=unclassified Nocardioides TaxID=2615069 RepID=UPI00361E13CC